MPAQTISTTSTIRFTLTYSRSRNKIPIPPRIEPLALRQRLQPARRPTRLTPLVRLRVPPPVDLDLSPLDTKQHDNARNCDTCTKRRRQDKVVLAPERKVPTAHVDPAQPRNGDRGPRVAETVGREVDAAEEEGHGVQLAEDALGLGEAVGAVLDGEPDEQGHDDAEGEAQEEGAVLAVVTKDFERADGAPEDASCEEGVWPGAVESHGRVFAADAFDIDL